MKQLTLMIIAVLLGLAGTAQEDQAKFDFRLGIGTSILGTGDMQTIMFENEVNLKLNRYFAAGGGLGYAQSNNGVFEQAAFIQLNANIYISPFRNNRKNDFRIGTGLSWYSVSDSYRSSSTYQDGQIVDSEYVFDRRNSVGLNLIIENTYTIADKFLLGLKLFSQPYQNGDINSGILIKAGIRI